VAAEPRGTVALHGGGEYVAGDELAMDALLAAGAASRAARRDGSVNDVPVRVVVVPTAVARHRPELAVAHGRTAFEASAVRLGIRIQVAAALLLDRAGASDAARVTLLDAADVIHLPGGDPDLVPAVLRATPAWAAILRAFDRGACVAGASAGAMALGARLWTREGPADGLGVVPGIAVLPHFDLRRAAAWRAAVDPDGLLTWLGLDERTLVIGRPGGSWTVHGAGRAHVIPPGAAEPTDAAGNGDSLSLVVR
jgi:cyanophycinase